LIVTDEINHLLFCLAEEAGEIAQAACKAGRFGPDDTYDNGVTNTEQIVKEVNDLLGVLQLLLEHGVPITGLANDTAVAKKVAKVNKYMQYALGKEADK
jgi:NTP pyrophosphatase (non-canonical NTP hydrolase)